jgi:hypothetical protein
VIIAERGAGMGDKGGKKDKEQAAAVDETETRESEEA